MDFRNRRGSVLVETLMMIGFFIAIILVYESKTKNHIGGQKNHRWEKKYD